MELVQTCCNKKSVYQSDSIHCILNYSSECLFKILDLLIKNDSGCISYFYHIKIFQKLVSKTAKQYVPETLSLFK